MAPERLTARLGPLRLRSPLVAASGTVGSVREWVDVADPSFFGAAVAKSVSPEPWPGRPPPRLAPLPTGMLNGIGIQNPGIDRWVPAMSESVEAGLGVPVWGSAVSHSADGYGKVAAAMAEAGVDAIELNLSCPNLDEGTMFSSRPTLAADAVRAARSATGLPLGAKLSPESPDLTAVAGACRDEGADFVVLTNTAMGIGISLGDRRPALSGGGGGYSGPGLKPISLRCVYEVARALPGFAIVGCGGVLTGSDVVEYLMAGASAVAMGTALLAEPDAGRRVAAELEVVLDHLGIDTVQAAVGLAH